MLFRSQLHHAAQRLPLLGAVGPLQFEVLQYRLETEYGAKSRLEPALWKIIRWVDPAGAVLTEDMLPSNCRLALDAAGQTVALFTAEWALQFFMERNPKIQLLSLPRNC